MSDILSSAIEFERQGYQKYLRLAEEADNPLARELFQTLAGDELEHARYIQELATSLETPGGEISPLPRHIPLEERMREVFARLGVTGGGSGIDNVEGLELAMDLEQGAMDLYRALLGEIEDPGQREVIETLLEQEWQHLEALANVHFFLTSTGQWLDRDESKRWNWMNI